MSFFLKFFKKNNYNIINKIKEKEYKIKNKTY